MDMIQLAPKFGEIVRPMRNGQPLTDWDEIQRLQEQGKLPRDVQNSANISYPGRGIYIVTPPDVDTLPTDGTLFKYLIDKGLDVTV
ncbi:MAG: hypothetical protein K2X01_02380 [Cyanobacteria bacterium]|nr:hypothetical protein [Cyanobacteriota bacterium]